MAPPAVEAEAVAEPATVAEAAVAAAIKAVTSSPTTRAAAAGVAGHSSGSSSPRRRSSRRTMVAEAAEGEAEATGATTGEVCVASSRMCIQQCWDMHVLPSLATATLAELATSETRIQWSQRRRQVVKLHPTDFNCRSSAGAGQGSDTQKVQ